MSLKAKIEAVIYAAEEPVTLAQLAAVFEREILASQPQPEEQPRQEPAAETAASHDTDASQDAADLPEPAAAETKETEQPTLPIAALADDAARQGRQRDKQVRIELEKIVRQLIADYASEERGMEIREIAGGYRMATKAEYHDGVRAFVKRLKPPMKLSLQALETLAVVAYKQPVTAPEISEIRGVDSGGVLGSLISRKLIATAGRKQVIGRPILYKTTKDFLLRFGLKDVNELPSLEEFEKMAAEMEDAEAADSSLHEEAAAEIGEIETDAPASEEDVTVMVTETESQAEPEEELSHEAEK